MGGEAHEATCLQRQKGLSRGEAFARDRVARLHQVQVSGVEVADHWLVSARGHLHPQESSIAGPAAQGVLASRLGVFSLIHHVPVGAAL